MYFTKMLSTGEEQTLFHMYDDSTGSSGIKMLVFRTAVSEDVFLKISIEDPDNSTKKEFETYE